MVELIEGDFSVTVRQFVDLQNVRAKYLLKKQARSEPDGVVAAAAHLGAAVPPEVRIRRSFKLDRAFSRPFSLCGWNIQRPFRTGCRPGARWRLLHPFAAPTLSDFDSFL